MDGLLLVGGRIAIIHQRQIDADTVAEPEELEVPVVPPAGVLEAEDDHQQGGKEKDPGDGGSAAAPATAAPERREHDQDRDHGEDPKPRREAVERTIGVVDRERQRIGAIGWRGRGLGPRWLRRTFRCAGLFHLRPPLASPGPYSAHAAGTRAQNYTGGSSRPIDPWVAELPLCTWERREGSDRIEPRRGPLIRP